MEHSKQDLNHLIDKYLSDEATSNERNMLERSYMKASWRTSKIDVPNDDAARIDNIGIESWETLIKKMNQAETKRLILWPRIAAIAAAVILMVSGVYFFNSSKKTDLYNDSLAARDIAPGTIGATLTLGNGKKIQLSNAVNGNLAQEAGVTITKSDNGSLVYQMKGGASGSDKVNTLSTAKGQTYCVCLPDGSLVWLNAASSLTYAVNLQKQGKRSVKLEGEAYFEIAKDKAHPFVVESRRQEIQVLGTHFNVNSYAYEAGVRTTLLEGSVQITPLQDPRKKVLLKPGEQALATKQFLKILPVDVEAATAWKNGNFFFKEEKLESILYKLAYWYDVDIVYQGKKPEMVMTGIIKRDTKLSKVLEIIEISGKVKFKIEGRRVFVMK